MTEVLSLMKICFLQTLYWWCFKWIVFAQVKTVNTTVFVTKIANVF